MADQTPNTPSPSDVLSDNTPTPNGQSVTFDLLSASTAYYLALSDSPGNHLTTYLLNGSNCLTYSRSMETALSAKNKWGFIDGTLVRPTKTDSIFSRRKVCDSMLYHLGVQHTHNGASSQRCRCKRGEADVGGPVGKILSQGNDAQIYQIKSEISLLKQEGRLLADYYSKLKGLWDELENYLGGHRCVPVLLPRRMPNREATRRPINSSWDLDRNSTLYDPPY
ncbi:hypothetical protein CRG98_028356 [Punica granatum]|uniref:Retrotransposon Copia-like N-terminal domain-containing protein n=1 Tax=Punica granatum TaxID=22663 RepID=A0A2I0J4U9_PUNGR|nr:hypothetical protein CRG98_028356 [Punica granatum]